jgi:SAM-dependent methyltransferase
MAERIGEAARLDAVRLQPLASAAVFGTPQIVAKVIPYAGDAGAYVIPRVRHEQPRDLEALPVPPPDLWEGYGGSPEEYLHGGRSHTAMMRDIMKKSGFPLEPGQRILDFGCASGRMIRFLDDLARGGEVWGADINEAHIYWCQQNLSPPFKFVNTATFPHLPFEDRYFDFIYAGSVFTHISELADAWLLELKRITRPGGRLFLSVHDRHFLELLFNTLPDAWLTTIVRGFDEQTHFIESDFAVATVSRSPFAQVFYDLHYLCERWGQFLKVVSVHPQGYGVQTVVLLEKPGGLPG